MAAYWCIVVLTALIGQISGDGTFIKEVKSEMTGVISTVNFPENYPPNLDQQWIIERAKNASCVAFFVEDFDIPTRDRKICPGDHFSLDSCGSWQDISPERYYCGDMSLKDKVLVQHFQPGSSSLSVSFHSDSQTEGKGLLMQYQQFDSDNCIRKLEAKFYQQDVVFYNNFTAVGGSFQTNGFHGQNYRNNLGSVYTIVRPNEFYCGIVLTTFKFDLEPNDGYGCYDYFAAPGCRKTCNNANHIWFFEYQPGAKAMQFHFYSDYDRPAKGFNIDYEQITDCFNPHQPECPNDHLVRNSFFNECDTSKKNECIANSECPSGRICCFDGCNRLCKTPVPITINNRTRRHAEIIAKHHQNVRINLA